MSEAIFFCRLFATLRRGLLFLTKFCVAKVFWQPTVFCQPAAFWQSTMVLLSKTMMLTTVVRPRHASTHQVHFLAVRTTVFSAVLNAELGAVRRAMATVAQPQHCPVLADGLGLR